MRSSFQILVSLFLLFVSGFGCTTAYANGSEKLLFTVRRNYDKLASGESVQIVLDLKEIDKRLPSVSKVGFTITDWNFGKVVPAQFGDSNNDGKADQIVYDFNFASN